MLLNDIFSQRKIMWDRMAQKRKRGQEKVKACPKCKTEYYSGEWKENQYICPTCHAYMPVPAKERMANILDENSFKELFPQTSTKDPLDFDGYEEKLQSNRKKTGMQDAFLAGSGKINNQKVAIGVLDGRFLMGSMGTAVGEKIVRLTEYAKKKNLPLIIFSASGGARMQEGLFSLMQMAKTAAAIEQFKRKGGLFISCLTNPTTGGVSASYASLGDIILAEPGALICFAGPRVIEQTIGQTLPEGFQRAEFLLEHGMIDCIVERKDFRDTLSSILQMHL